MAGFFDIKVSRDRRDDKFTTPKAYDRGLIMIHEYSAKANAKINIFLKVCGKYPNGYHRLYMLMQEIDLADDIKVTIDDDRDFGIAVASDRADFDMKKDLCYRAAESFYKEIGDETRCGFTGITAIKHTPAQAGLGGGSSDAAAILKILNKHYGEPIGLTRMLEIAAALGADVPFFLYGGSAFCEGIGEIVTPLPSLKGLKLLLVKPAQGVPTGPCFKAVDAMTEIFDEEEYKNFMGSVFMDETLSPSDRIRKAGGRLTNDLQAPAVAEVPLIEELLGLIGETDCLFAAMSGSGSTVYGIYEDNTAAELAKAKVEADPRTAGCMLCLAEML